jgi:hypothetical protein
MRRQHGNITHEQDMKSAEAIHERIQRLQERISLLEQKYAAEMQKHHTQRDTKLMRFLLEEQSVYRFALSQLTWVVEKDTDGSEP